MFPERETSAKIFKQFYCFTNSPYREDVADIFEYYLAESTTAPLIHIFKVLVLLIPWNKIVSMQTMRLLNIF